MTISGDWMHEYAKQDKTECKDLSRCDDRWWMKMKSCKNYVWTLEQKITNLNKVLK